MNFSLDKQEIRSMVEKDFAWLDGWDSKLYPFSEQFNLYSLQDKGYEHYSGAVKYCLVNEEFNGYVVKFCIEKEFDYCEREYNNYLAAVERGLERYFPYTDFLCKIGRFSLYIQEEAVVDEESITDIWVSAINESSGGCYEDNEEREYDSVWDYVDDTSDEERIAMTFKSDELENFCNEFVINDLHSGNFGYINDRLVIIDFSGFGYWVKNRSF